MDLETINEPFDGADAVFLDTSRREMAGAGEERILDFAGYLRRTYVLSRLNLPADAAGLRVVAVAQVALTKKEGRFPDSARTIEGVAAMLVNLSRCETFKVRADRAQALADFLAAAVADGDGFPEAGEKARAMFGEPACGREAEGKDGEAVGRQEG
jgi:hypothetical protein